MLQKINQSSFEQTIQDNEVVLVDFYADWCGPCQALHPTLEKLSKEYSGTATIAKVNVDQEPELSQNFGVRSIPALFYFKNGELVGKQNGAQPYHILSQNLDQVING